MRKYISKRDLAMTLRQLRASNDPQFMKIYREVILLHATRDEKRFAHAAKMVFLPRRIFLTALNAALLMAGCLTLLAQSMALEDTSVQIFWAWILLAFLLEQVWRFFSLCSRLPECRPYVLIDELLARRILILQSKTPTHQNHAKAAK